MKLPIYKTITQSLGFAWNEYDTTARLAWFPLVLLLFVTPFIVAQIYSITDIAAGSFQEALPLIFAVESVRFIVSLILTTTFMVPLYQYAARDITPPQRSIYLAFGGRHLKLIFAQILVALSIAIFVYLPFLVASVFIQVGIEGYQALPWAVFPDETSLHTIELVQKDPWVLLSIQNILSVLLVIFVAYVATRLTALPVFATVREKADQYNSFAMSLKVSKGWNVLRLFLVILIIGVLMFIVTLVVNIVIIPMVIITVSFIVMFIQSANGMVTSTTGSAEGEISYLFFVIQSFINMLVMFYTYGVTTGLGGALFRHGQAMSD